MNNKLSHLRLRKVRELLKSQLGLYRLRKNGDVRYGRNLIDFIFRPVRTSLPEFISTLVSGDNLESMIDDAYSNFILDEYNLLDKGADFKFNTIRNVFKYGFKSDSHMINHYSDRLSLSVLSYLRTEFKDLDVHNFVVPVKVKIKVILKGFEDSIYDYIKRDFALVRAGPYNIRSPLMGRAVA
jgi:hypothetical protein